MKSVFLSGIGGIGMANLAVLLKAAGFDVSGSDGSVYEPAATILKDACISVLTPYASANLPDDNTPIIIGNAHSRGHVEVEAALNRGSTLYSFPEFLGRFILPGRHSMIVAGTHGKSTTSACLAHVLNVAGEDPGLLVGALPVDFPSGARLGSGLPFVVEGDEYDSAFFDKRSKFLHYFPRTLLLGPVEFDHADIFANLDDMLISYRRLINLLPATGTIIFVGDNALSSALASAAPCRKVSVGLSDSCDWRLLPDVERLRFVRPGGNVAECGFESLGTHNRMNALMALAAAESYKSNLPAYLSGTSSFGGIRRRLEKRLEQGDIVIYEDFAHHPTAIASALDALRERYPGHRLIAVFEPRSNTMVRNIFQEELPLAFRNANCVILGTIHRRDRIPEAQRLNPTLLGQALTKLGVEFSHLPNDQILRHLTNLLDNQPTVIIFMSNGSFDGVIQGFVDHVMALQLT